MLSTLTKILSLLSQSERRGVYWLVGMILVMALLEAAGVASIFPFISVLTDPELVDKNPYLREMYALFAFQDRTDFFILLGALVFVTLLVSISFKALSVYVLLRFTQMINYSMSCRMVGGYLRHPYEWFLNRHSADLGQTVLAEIVQVINGALIPMLQLVAQSAVVLSILTLLIIFDPFLAVVTAISLGGAYIIIYIILRGYLARIGIERLEANQMRYRVVQETFAGVKDVKVAGLEEVMLKSFERPARRYAEASASSSVASQMPRYVLELLVFGGLLGMSLYLMVGDRGVTKALPVISLYAIAGYRLMPAMQQLYAHISTLRVADALLDKLHRDIRGLPQRGSPDHGTPPLEFKETLHLDEVTYSYPGSSQPTLDRVTINIPALTTVGLMGVTGSGKTTTVDVILGLLKPKTGGLLVDGKLINEDNVRSWQRTIGYVPQHIHLTDDTIRANIAFGVPAREIDEDAVKRAASIANLHDFIVDNTPCGYDTHIGDRGVRLSGGQRQRIGIARAVYHDPSVLILDEATSALDNLSEQAVMDAVRNLGHRKTIILVAHRLSTLRSCDQIFLLQHGTVKAHGSFESLLAECAEFRAMAGEPYFSSRG
jgi:ABC-type multidrug transport system fused ATPase/permease subunit